MTTRLGELDSSIGETNQVTVFRASFYFFLNRLVLYDLKREDVLKHGES